MITENLSTLKIHNLTKEQYERELEAGRIDENALYLTPYEEIDLSVYATTDNVNSAIEEVRAEIPEIPVQSVNGMTGDVVIETPTLDSLGAQPAGDYALKSDIMSPDWNQNDQDALDYVKNRPFYMGDIIEDVILEETACDFTSGKPSISASKTIEAGQTYVVVWNGVEYVEVAEADSSGNILLGNKAGLDPADGGKPFLVAYIAFMNAFYVSQYDGSTTATLSIAGRIQEIHPLDEKYMPESFKKKAGLQVEDTVYTIDGEEVVAGMGAEIFNSYVTNRASGIYSHAEGHYTTASGNYSHAEGYVTTASGNYSHAEGRSTASGSYSHAEGGGWASGSYSHAEGSSTASGSYSHAEGESTTASGEHQHVQGRYNINDVDSDGNPLNTYAHIIGNGTSGNTSNAHTLDWNGIGWFAGGLKVGGVGQDDEAAKTVATLDDVDAAIANLVNSAPDTLNTLDELAAALGDDENFAATVTNQIADKVSKTELTAEVNSALTAAKESGEFDGADGYTPVRGTDYWTDADKAEIKAYVDEAILGGAW